MCLKGSFYIKFSRVIMETMQRCQNIKAKIERKKHDVSGPVKEDPFWKIMLKKQEKIQVF